MPNLSNSANSSYYEAILQLRPDDDEVRRFVINRLKERKNIFIAKAVKLKTGIDLYLSDQRFTRALGKKLKRSFKGKLIMSRTLHGRNRQTSKDVYRVTVCFRLDEKPQTQ
jgi:nonsense-mediated mRNA decay protein 3